ncbi:MAG: hypothetical protein ACTHKJ_10095, partial [Candidatus Nitrosocosmicus sp.]
MSISINYHVILATVFPVTCYRKQTNFKIKNAIYYLDAQSKQKRMTIYQLIYELFQKDVIEEKPIQWAESIPR